MVWFRTLVSSASSPLFFAASAWPWTICCIEPSKSATIFVIMPCFASSKAVLPTAWSAAALTAVAAAVLGQKLRGLPDVRFQVVLPFPCIVDQLLEDLLKRVRAARLRKLPPCWYVRRR